MSLFKKIKSSLKSNPNETSFKHLSNLIKNEDEINLNADIIIEDDEIDEFLNGIRIERDNLIINGNGHAIDGRNKVRIFEIEGYDIILKNISFKDAQVQYIHGGAIKNSSEKLIIQNCIFEGNSTQWEGGAILNEGSLLLENTLFKNNDGKRGGGAITSNGHLSIINCEFTSNQTEYDGGAIYAKNIVNIEKSRFKDNHAKSAGSIQIYYTSTVTISDSIFINCIDENNELIAVDNCYLNIIDSHFLNNRQSGGLSARWSKINIENARFKDNLKAISTEECDLTLVKTRFINNMETILSDSYLNILQCEFLEEANSEFTIRLDGNEDSSFNIESNTFDCESSIIIHLSEGYCISKHNTYNLKDDFISNENDGNGKKYLFFNENGEFESKNDKFNNPQLKIIYNNNIFKTEDELEDLIENGPDCQLKPLKEELPEDIKGFGHLEDLINENDELNLDYDIILHEAEKDFFEGGIEISKDNFRINGNGHIIDACEFSRIFYLTANNITFKNITFKNGKYFKNKLDDDSCGGGAICLQHNTSLKLINCRFIDNSSRQSSGAIKSNGDELTIINCKFESNIAHNGNSGAIYNKKGNLILENCEFNENHSKESGGAVYNKNGKLSISSCGFKSNYVEEEFFVELRGGAAYNENGELFIINSNFEDNKCFRGGAVFNAGESFRIEDSYFSKNQAEEGASIYNLSNDQYCIINCTFENNESQGAGIYNKESNLYLERSRFNENISTQSGGALYNDKGEINLKDCDFEYNRALWGKCGGAISSFYGSSKLENCSFSKNSARNGGAIDNYHGKWILNDCSFNENSSDMNGGSIVNRENGSIKICNSNFNNNEAATATDIYNIEGEMDLLKCEFENSNEIIILNEDKLRLTECKTADYHTISNLKII